MSCNSSATLGPANLWSKKSTTVELFFPLTSIMKTTGINAARAAFELENSSGALHVRPAYRLSNDGDSWDAAVELGSDFLSGDGVKYPSGYTALAVALSGRQFVQFGMLTKNQSGSQVEQGFVTMTLDLE